MARYYETDLAATVARLRVAYQRRAEEFLARYPIGTAVLCKSESDGGYYFGVINGVKPNMAYSLLVNVGGAHFYTHEIRRVLENNEYGMFCELHTSDGGWVYHWPDEDTL